MHGEEGKHVVLVCLQIGLHTQYRSGIILLCAINGSISVMT